MLSSYLMSSLLGSSVRALISFLLDFLLFLWVIWGLFFFGWDFVCIGGYKFVVLYFVCIGIYVNNL